MNFKKVSLTSVFVIILMIIATIASNFHNIYLGTLGSICFFTALNLGSISMYNSLDFSKNYKKYLFSFFVILLNVIVGFIFGNILTNVIFY